MLRVCFLIFCLLLPTSAAPLDEVGRPADESEIVGPVTRFKVDLAGAKDNVKIVKLRDGSVAYIVKRLGSGTDRLLTPVEFTELLYSQRMSGGWLQMLFNITSPAGIAWVALGLGGQILFTGRMIVQWMVSEKHRRSVVPVSFWWMSLIGATMLLIYFVWRRDIVGILGQGTGWFIYIRNLVLISKLKR